MLSYESKFSSHVRNMGNSCFLEMEKYKDSGLFMYFLHKNRVKNKGTIPLTNHFYLG